MASFLGKRQTLLVDEDRSRELGGRGEAQGFGRAAVGSGQEELAGIAGARGGLC